MVTVNNPVVIPISRDYTREAPTGTSVSYAVRRLGRKRPDLLDKVKIGEPTLNLPWRRVFLIGFGRLKNLWSSRPDV
jgi:hypothetical protein